VADAAAGSTFVDSLGITQSVVGADGIVDNTVTWSGILGRSACDGADTGRYFR
jgi:hypothetical protein